jgi:hypothetical protein
MALASNLVALILHPEASDSCSLLEPDVRQALTLDVPVASLGLDVRDVSLPFHLDPVIPGRRFPRPVQYTERHGFEPKPWTVQLTEPWLSELDVTAFPLTFSTDVAIGPHPGDAEGWAPVLHNEDWIVEARLHGSGTVTVCIQAASGSCSKARGFPGRVRTIGSVQVRWRVRRNNVPLVRRAMLEDRIMALDFNPMSTVTMFRVAMDGLARVLPPAAAVARFTPSVTAASSEA